MLGIIVKNLNCSQLNYEIFRQLCVNHKKLNAFLVYRNLTPNFYPISFPVINYSKIFSGYLDKNSLLIATDLDSALALSKVKNKSKKIFYVWELEFLKHKNFNLLQPIYNSLSLVTRSESYKQALENYTNKNVSVLDFDLEKIWTKNM